MRRIGFRWAGGFGWPTGWQMFSNPMHVLESDSFLLFFFVFGSWFVFGRMFSLDRFLANRWRGNENERKYANAVAAVANKAPVSQPRKKRKHTAARSIINWLCKILYLLNWLFLCVSVPVSICSNNNKKSNIYYVFFRNWEYFWENLENSTLQERVEDGTAQAGKRHSFAWFNAIWLSTLAKIFAPIPSFFRA